MNSRLSIANYEAVIFDMDGVLVDSEPQWKIAMEQVFKSVGLDMERKDFQKTVGLRIDEVISFWNQHKNLGIQDEKVVEDAIIDRMIELVHENPMPLEGVNETLIYLKKIDIKIGLATSSPYRLLNAVLSAMNIDKYFDFVHSAEKESHGKPHPAVYISVAETLSIQPDKCLVVEDSFNGVISGKAAKMDVVCIPEKTHEPNLKLNLADYIFEDMSKMLDVLKKV
jgi:sugar-phosphatase